MHVCVCVTIVCTREPVDVMQSSKKATSECVGARDSHDVLFSWLVPLKHDGAELLALVLLHRLLGHHAECLQVHLCCHVVLCGCQFCSPHE